MNLSIYRHARTASYIGHQIVRRKNLRAEFRDEAVAMFDVIEQFLGHLRRRASSAEHGCGVIESGILALATSLTMVTPVRFCLRVYASQVKTLLDFMLSDWVTPEALAELSIDGDVSKQIESLRRVQRWAGKAGQWQESAFYPRDKNRVDLKDTVPYLVAKRYRRQ